MKRIYIAIMTAIVAMMAVSCKDNKFLDLKDPDSFDETKFYRDSVDMEGLLAASYASLRAAYDKLFFVTEMKSDNASTTNTGDSGGLYYNFVNHTVSSSNSIVAEIYNAFYFCIHRSNLVLEHIDAVEMSKAEHDRIQGEAMFLRALSHFYLVRLWGPVTIMRHSMANSKDAAAMKRNSVAEVYDFIISDLKTLADSEMLPKTCVGADFGRASRTAAAALLGRVYLQYAATQDQPTAYNDAITYLEKAVELTGYGDLGLGYSKLFDLTGQTDAEIIFPIMYMSTEAECSNFAAYFQPSGATGLTSQAKGRGFNCGQENLYKEFEVKDVNGPSTDRRVATAITKYVDGTYYTKKYIDLSSAAGYGGNLWFELRFADVYLMLAEAYERVEGGSSAKAIAYLDKVRLRTKSSVKGYQDSAADPSYASAYPTLRDAIFHERRVELCFENQRWFDLMRLYPNAADFEAFMRNVQEPGAGGKYTNFRAYEVLLPIPYDEVFLNPGLGQNDGY